ncbi:MAG: NUDIX hydrolase, partial [Bacteroidetes bacterium]|nr:NUDIX hydrolase [Bacteroidota bacterium]
KPKHFQLAPGEEATDAQWFPVRDVPSLPFDHGEILETALKTLKWKVRHQPIGFELLPEKFTLLQLQDLYQAILEKKLDKSNFRRKLKNIDVLTPLGEKQTGVAHRAAELYKFNIQRYQSLTKSGFVVEFV